MKKPLFILVLFVCLIGLISSFDMILNTIFNAILFTVVVGLILYAVYYFKILTPDQRKYRKALRKSRKKYKKKKYKN